MKKIVFIMTLAAAVCFTSCGGGKNVANVSLKTPEDSLAFAVSLAKSQTLSDIVYGQLGVDSAYIDEFVRGVCDAFPMSDDAKTKAYVAGLSIGSQAANVYEGANEEVYENDSVNKIDRRMFLAGLIAGVYNDDKVMTMEQAIEYSDRVIYRQASEDFMAENKTREGVVTLPSGLQYKMEVKGTGAVATAQDTVSVIYRGSFPNGRTFDSSRGKETAFPVDRVVPGFSEALQILPEGSKCKVYIPWQLGYGKSGNRSIPPYSTLIFDIEVMRVIKAKK
ncbi:MAG: FKBP-type peptidyl-prolyl cis-trans isomerase [Bacteroidaceae bacterium]|nr:FKBP-type peptidyl-prolyl cis-trans isomerase [Bacteroidaceae bacterium]